MNKEIIKHLLTAPDSQLDTNVKPLIEKWSDSPTPLEILEVLDYCVNGSLASGFTIKVLQILYEDACKNFGTVHDEVVKNATWRNK